MRLKRNRRSLHYAVLPGFPVEFGGVGTLHAAFLNESSTRGHVRRWVAGNPGPVEMTNLIPGLEDETWGAVRSVVAPRLGLGG